MSLAGNLFTNTLLTSHYFADILSGDVDSRRQPMLTRTQSKNKSLLNTPANFGEIYDVSNTSFGFDGGGSLRY